MFSLRRFNIFSINFHKNLSIMPFFKFLFKLIKPLLSNQIIFYLFSRYFTYFIQFIISIVLAVKLGAYYLGIWSFIVLIINYFGQIDFGIANSLNVFLIQNRDDSRISSIFIFNALLLLTFFSFLIFMSIFFEFTSTSGFQNYPVVKDEYFLVKGMEYWFREAHF